MKNRRPKNITKKAQFIFGIGASSWFHIVSEKSNYRITRYSEEGELECSKLFQVENKNFDITKPYLFTYLSTCKECTIEQNSLKYKFKTIRDED
ncbi:MAG: DUF6695 family protein [Bacteroidota bacterium]|nr:DUF6695 family protein [Bacteroidota bacterium]